MRRLQRPFYKALVLRKGLSADVHSFLLTDSVFKRKCHQFLTNVPRLSTGLPHMATSKERWPRPILDAKSHDGSEIVQISGDLAGLVAWGPPMIWIARPAAPDESSGICKPALDSIQL